MNREDIIRMAREAGFNNKELDDGTDEAFDIRYVRFAILVAIAENEACAKIGDYFHDAEANCGDLIRARGQA